MSEKTLLIRNIGLCLSGDLAKPLIELDAILCRDGKIVGMGRERDLDTDRVDVTVNANGCALSPGLIDSHVHPVAGDWTPRQSQINWIESSLHGGVTCMISAGEVHMPGRPKDPVGLKAMAITSQRIFDAFRPAGVKVKAGAPVIEQGLEAHDFADLAEAGVTMLGEIGLGSVKTGEEAAKMVRWARSVGIQSTIHTGGPSIPGSGLIDRDVVLEADADIIGHINGGHTALPDDQIVSLCSESTRGIELVHNGNERSALLALRTAREIGQEERVILGTDAPAGSGAQPLGIIRMIAMLSSLGDIPAERVFCYATGNTARLRGLDSGLLKLGRAADFALLDRAQHSAGRDLLESIQLGDLPGVGMTIIDAEIRTMRSRNTPPAERLPFLS